MSKEKQSAWKGSVMVEFGEFQTWKNFQTMMCHLERNMDIVYKQ